MNLGDNFVLLETERRDRENSQNILFTNPVDIIVAQREDSLRNSFKKIDKYLRQQFYVAGFITYEAGYMMEDVLRPYGNKTEQPLLWFGVYKSPRISNKPFITEANNDYYLSAPRMSIPYNDYVKNIKIIKDFISRGHVYQINYTLKNKFTFYGDIVSFYKALKDNQKVAYCALIGCQDKYIVSLSPELFFRICESNIKVKPMKGTAPANLPLRWLTRDKKNMSENVMIVDLLRNDLGRICQPGTVNVSKMYDVERYDTVLQMTSTISGMLRPGINAHDIISNIFPSGSVTGAPKIQSMKIISDLEKAPRGIYTGAIGYFGPKGESVFSVAIRTIELNASGVGKYHGEMGVGGGIVHESNAKKEYDECRLKGKFLIKSIPKIVLIETMLCKDGKIKFLRMHLRRLRESARYFLMPCNILAIENDLKKYAHKLKGQIRLRLTLKSNGKVKIEHRRLPDVSPVAPHVAFSEYATNSENPFLFHKTSCRALYDQEYFKNFSQGFYDVLFCNEKKQITEGAISNIFVQIKGRYYTPPVFCGLLNGVQRQVFIKKFAAKERILYRRDLEKAEKIILTNSIRGAKQVYLRDNC